MHNDVLRVSSLGNLGVQNPFSVHQNLEKNTNVYLVKNTAAILKTCKSYLALHNYLSVTFH